MILYACIILFKFDVYPLFYKLVFCKPVYVDALIEQQVGIYFGYPMSI